MIDGTLRIEGDQPFPFVGWFVRITDQFGNDWWGAAFPTHGEAVAWAKSNLRGHQWAVILLAGNLRRAGPNTEQAARENPKGVAKALDRHLPLKMGRDYRHDPQ